MCPILFKLGPISIYAYGTMLALAFLVVTFLLRKEASSRGIGPNLISDFCFWVLVVGIIGARLLYVLLNISYYLNNPLEIIMLQHGGLVWYGGLFFGIVSGLYFLRRHFLGIGYILDMIAPFVALGEAIGRIGCLLNGCCYGRPSIFGLYFPVHKAVLIPTQLYWSVFLLVVFLILRIIQSRANKKLLVFFSYLMLHSFGRFFLEFLRGDSLPIFLNLNLFQLISISVFIIGAIGIISRQRIPRISGRG